MPTSTIDSSDGVQLTVQSVGSGPGVVILHGGGVTSKDYRRLATALADRFTVHLYDRRGYGEAPPLEPTWDLSVAVEDVRAIVTATGSTRIFGHSMGGVIALQAALHVPLQAVAVFDPPVAIDGLFPTDFLEPFETSVADGDLPSALAHLNRTINSGVATRLPMGVQRAFGQAFLHTSWGKGMAAVMPTIAREIRASFTLAGPAASYAGIEAPLLLARGARSPEYYRPICDRLAGVVPRGRAITVPGSHNAANIARPAFVAPFAEFFTSPS
jgi:pimeloyl-ACP methyl ester carboxylesterase